MTVKEAAVRLELSPSTLYQLCQQGLFPHSRLGAKGGLIRISEEDLALYRASVHRPMRRAASKAREVPAMRPKTDWMELAQEKLRAARRT